MKIEPVFYMGVDPGLNGAVALLDPFNELTVIDMPTGVVSVNKKMKRRIIPEILALEISNVVKNKYAVAMVEKVSSMPNQGVSSVFQFGTSYGMIIGMLAALKIEQHQAHPATWKKHFRLASGKDASRHKVCSMFPKQAGLFARVKDDGRAEAVLLAVYARDIS